jgi:hypothetical protein
MNNYRPISLTPIINKILESHINNQLSEYLEQQNILFNHQYGFRKKSNTINAVFDMISQLQSNLDRGDLGAIVFIDIKKAFDTVDRDILILKLHEIGADESTILWFQDYFRNRKQFMEFDKIKSSMKNTKYGVPQGSILGPTLFLLYINNMKHLNLHGKVYQYADDMALVYSSKSINELQEMMQMDLDNIFLWMQSHKLTVNVNKTKFMTFNNRGSIFNIQYNNVNIEEVKEFQYLGIFITSDLKWIRHKQHIRKKISPITGVFRKIQEYIPYKLKRSLFYSMFYPYIQYGLNIWACGYDYIVDEIQKLQNKALKNLYNQPFRTRTKILHSKFNVLSIKTNFEVYSKIHIHNIRKKFTLSNSNIVYNNQIHSHNTRNNFDIHTGTTRTANYGVHSIFKSASILYNNLPEDFKELNKDQFKMKMKKIAQERNQILT